MAAQTVISAIVLVVALAIFLMVLGLVSRRLLGVRIGRIRVLLAAMIGLGAEFGFESQVVWALEPAQRWVFIPVQIAITVGVALVALVVAELLLPSGTWPRPDKWLTGARSAVVRSRRYWQVSRIAARHSLFATRRPRRRQVAVLEPGETSRARDLRLALQEAGVTFVKFGQLLSTRADLLPPDYIAELSQLQQQVEPVPWEQIQEVLTAELGSPPHEIFADITAEPVAAA